MDLSLSKEIVSALSEQFAEGFIKTVVNDVRTRRHRIFFDSFVEMIGKSDKQNSISQILNEISSSSELKEFFYERYREVSLSKTNDIGPLLIAILTAKIFMSGRKYANSNEEKFFTAAETLTHKELVDAFNYFKNFIDNEEIYEHGEKAQSAHFEVITVDIENSDKAARGTELPENLENHLGSWLTKLHNIGLIKQTKRQFINSGFASYKDDGSKVNARLTIDLTLQLEIVELFCEIFEISRQHEQSEF